MEQEEKEDPKRRGKVRWQEYLKREKGNGTKLKIKRIINKKWYTIQKTSVKCLTPSGRKCFDYILYNNKSSYTKIMSSA